MKKLTLLVLASSLVFGACSKKDSTDNGDVKKQVAEQQNKNNTQNNNGTSNAGPSFKVKSIGEAGGKMEMVDFTWNENGKETKLSDFKGKVIVLNFWATWCGPCKKELPSLSQLSSDLKDKNFKMIGISVDDDQSTVNNFLNANKLSYTILHEPTGLVSKYMSVTGQNENVIPQTYVINKEGKVVESLIGSRSKEDFLTIINKYL